VIFVAFLFFSFVFGLSFCPSPFSGLNCKKSLLKFWRSEKGKYRQLSQRRAISVKNTISCP
jgi:hypothetical protein